MSRPRRLHGFDYRGRHSCFLTFCTYKRRELFVDVSIAGMVLRQILRTAGRLDFAVFAYCVMPDHVHLLLRGRSERADLRHFAKTAKQSTGQLFRGRLNEPLWQEGYYDRVVRPEDDPSGIARYIIENPVRAGARGLAVRLSIRGLRPLDDRRDHSASTVMPGPRRWNLPVAGPGLHGLL